MDEGAFGRLCEDVRANGLLDPITLHEGKVLDGRHRLRACNETGVWPVFTEYEGDSPAQFVLSHNLARRHLSVSQRAMVAMDFLPHLAEEAKSRQGKKLPKATSRSDDREVVGTWEDHDPQHRGTSGIAGDAVGVSAATVRRAKRVSKADPAIAAEVRDGKLTVSEAVAEIERKRGGEPELGLARPAAVKRIVAQAEALSNALSALNLPKSVARMNSDERETALASCNAGLRALKAMASALRASDG